MAHTDSVHTRIESEAGGATSSAALRREGYGVAYDAGMSDARGESVRTWRADGEG